jgi:hypothetical protein
MTAGTSRQMQKDKSHIVVKMPEELDLRRAAIDVFIS